MERGINRGVENSSLASELRPQTFAQKLRELPKSIIKEGVSVVGSVTTGVALGVSAAIGLCLLGASKEVALIGLIGSGICTSLYINSKIMPRLTRELPWLQSLKSNK